ncbi:heme-binding domain-containing protein [Chitinophaga dinghuensis]|uniref:heme-binding domain-containing protein n=1 Tax=Chitinophaga dinghuensis TaxID=1539050 RepID=UPI001FE7EA39|nr:heme-binding domain-containing protein [Chitinophaga dinghuensis]
MKILKKIFGVLLLLLVAIQFFRPVKNQGRQEYTQDFLHQYQAPPEISDMLKVACYDCHSNNTRYPWYANIQPVAWYLTNHIRDGKKDLNFDEFGSYTPKRQQHKLEEIQSQVKKGKMPLASYTLIHADARLTVAQRDTLVHWIDGLLQH